jgi:hypothetical protein
MRLAAGEHATVHQDRVWGPYVFVLALRRAMQTT